MEPDENGKGGNEDRKEVGEKKIEGVILEDVPYNV
jgi:hypothetical protein